MATSYFYFCDYCRNLTDTIYIDQTTGAELCLQCFNDLSNDDEIEFEYDEQYGEDDD